MSVLKDIEKIFKRVSKLALGGKNNELEYKRMIDNFIENNQYDYFLLCLEKYYKIDAFEYKTVSHVKQLWPDILEKTKSPLINRLTNLYKQKQVYQIAFDIRSESNDFVSLNLGETLSSTYSTTGVNPHINFTKSENEISINILNPNVYNIDINKTDWNIYSNPTQIKLIESFTTPNDFLGTASYTTNIPFENGVYMIKVDSRDSYYSFRYRLEVIKDDFLGTIKEVDSIDNSTNYFVRNKKLSEILSMKKTFLEVKKRDMSEPITIIAEDPNKSEEMNLYNRYVLAIEYLLS
jgi:hypothetical protein